MRYIIKLSFFLTFFGFFTATLFAQQLPSDLSKAKSVQITDAMLAQMAQKAKESNLTKDDVIKQFKDRGMPDTEVQMLSERLGLLMPDVEVTTTAGQPNGSSSEQSVKRTFKGDAPIFVAPPLETSRVFGAELFTSADPLFVPNLKIATPRSYMIGPDDELQLDVYGNNISSQTLTVSPDGFISVKYAGPVNVGGMTIEQAAGVLKARLTKYYPSLSSGETKVQLTLGSIRSIQVTIVGAVRKPGTMTLPSLATFFNALYTCGGPTCLFNAADKRST